MADFESPISVLPRPGDGVVTLTDQSSIAKFVVRSDGRPFEIDVGTSAEIAGAWVCGSRPGEWLVLGGADACAAALATLRPEPFTNVIELTHGRALFRLHGERAGAVMAKVCNLDFSDQMTPDGAAVSGSVVGVACDLLRAGDGATPSYLIVADRSVGAFLFDALIDAGAEYGIGIGSPDSKG